MVDGSLESARQRKKERSGSCGPDRDGETRWGDGRIQSPCELVLYIYYFVQCPSRYSPRSQSVSWGAEAFGRKFQRPGGSMEDHPPRLRLALLDSLSVPLTRRPPCEGPAPMCSKSNSSRKVAGPAVIPGASIRLGNGGLLALVCSERNPQKARHRHELFCRTRGSKPTKRPWELI